jgi:response regulator NasT
MDPRLKVLLVRDQPGQITTLQEALRSEVHNVVGDCQPDDSLLLRAQTAQPDVMVVEVDKLTAEMIQALESVDRVHALPVLLFVARNDRALMRRALAAGVSVYVVDDVQPHRLAALFAVAFARFECQHALRKNLQELRNRLADERDIERAKGVIMKRQRLSENEAGEMLDRLARNRKQSIGEFSRTVLQVAAVA